MPPPELRSQFVYFLPKLHKSPLKMRPIVACCSGPTETASAYVDRFLQPMMKMGRSFIANTTDLINKLSLLTLPPDCLLVTLDVSSLYTNISHQDALDAVSTAFSDYNAPHLPPLDIFKQLVNFVLKNNVFNFNGETFHQLHGVAMGTKLAPALANIFLAQLEEKYIEGCPNPPLAWLRYIDDVFCIWTHTRSELDSFILGLNNIKPRIKFTAEISTSSMVFLDLRVYKGSNFNTTGRLQTEISYKVTNNFTYIHGTSYHPRHVYKGVAKGEALRILRNCSEVDPSLLTLRTSLTSYPY